MKNYFSSKSYMFFFYIFSSIFWFYGFSPGVITTCNFFLEFFLHFNLISKNTLLSNIKFKKFIFMKYENLPKFVNIYQEKVGKEKGEGGRWKWKRTPFLVHNYPVSYFFKLQQLFCLQNKIKSIYLSVSNVEAENYKGQGHLFKFY